MVYNVSNESELAAAIAANNDTIKITADFTVTSLYGDTNLLQLIEGQGHTITLNVTTSTIKAFVKTSATVSDLAITGSYTLGDQSTPAAQALLVESLGHLVTNVYIHDFTVNCSAITTAEYYAGLFGGSGFAEFSDIWIRNLNVIKSAKAGCDIITAADNTNEFTVERISITRDSGNTNVITPCGRNNLVEWSNAYIYNVAMVKNPLYAGHFYGAKTGSSGLKFNTNCSLTDDTFTESAREGKHSNSPDWETLEFTEDNGWVTTAGYPMLETFMEDITITAPSVVAVNTNVSFTASNPQGATAFTWTFSDGGTASGASVIHTFTSAGVYTATATVGSATRTHTITVIDVTVTGSTKFANGVSSTITAAGSVTGLGSYLWSDGCLTAAHTHTYTGHDNGDTITLTCTYTYGGVAVNKSITLTCVKTTLSISANPITVGLAGTTTITSSYDNAETPTSVVIQRSEDSGSTWSDITYQTPYSCTFADSVPKSHSFRLKFTGAIQGTIYSSVCVVNTVYPKVTISGNDYFLNGVAHTLTATQAGFLGTGTFTWSDGVTGAVHTQTYTGQADNSQKTLTVTYTESGTSVTDSKTITCINGSVSITTDRAQCGLIDTVNLTMGYTGHESVTQTLQTSIDGGLTWTNLSVVSPMVITYSDSSATTHIYKYTVKAPIQGTLTSTVSVKTTNSSVTITAPVNNAKIFVNNAVSFTSTTLNITNPTFSWSTGETTQNFTKTFTATTAPFNVTVTATGTEGTYKDTHSIQIIPSETCKISAPSTFTNGVAVSFTVPDGAHLNPTNITWYFPNSETATGNNVTKTFTGYTIGDIISVGVGADYIDSCGNTQHGTATMTLKCAPVYSYYVNPRGETFIFNADCKILREGMRGFSEIQANTSVVSGHDFNDVNGIDYNNRQLTFNIFVKGDRATMHAKRRELVHILAPQKELGTFHYYRDDGAHFIIRCNVAIGFPSFQDESVKGGWVGTMSFIAPNGVWYSPTITVSCGSTIVYDGDVPCGFRATLTGNLLNSANNEELSAVTGASLVGYTVDTEAGTVYDTNRLNGWGNVSLNSTLVRLEIGNNTITGCASISYNAKYLGV